VFKFLRKFLTVGFPRAQTGPALESESSLKLHPQSA
jgi:hypothetical protein